jgi:hypothetical protein
MALKGHTKIELTNVNTGEVEIYEDDNMVTNALGMFVEQTGCFNFNWFSLNGVIKTSNPDILLSRGLMLFSDTINEDPTIVYPPPGNYMVGQASTQTYTGIQTTFGSYNTNESGQIEKGWRWVWDFNESQSNGKINCACLTSQTGGLMGAGSDIGPDDGHVCGMHQFYPVDSRWSSNAYNYRDINLVATVNTNIHSGFMSCIYIDLENNCFYSFKELPVLSSSNNFYNMLKYKRIIIQKCRLPINNFSLFEHRTQDSQKVIETFTLNIPEDIVNEYSSFFNSYANATSSSCSPCCMNEFNKHIYIYINTYTKYGNSSSIPLPAGATFFILDIDIENKDISYFNITNTTGQSVTIPTDVGINHNIYTTDKYVFIQANDGKVYRISREDNSDVIKLTYHNGNEVSLGNVGMFWVEVGGKLYGTRCQVRSSYNTVYCIDPEGCTIQRMAADARSFPGLYNAGTSSNEQWQATFPPVARMYGTKYGPLYAAIPTIHNSATQYICPFIFPNYLLTINNLPQEIIKSPEQTMKVIYTITNEN